MVAEHEATMAASEAMLARRNADNKQFRYIVRAGQGELASGSLPSQIFQAEPASALARIYDGAWEYAQDAEGRALVNSNPLHWLLILDWLSFGAVPEEPTKAFIAECTYWQLDKLIAAMQAQDMKPVTSSSIPGKRGHHFAVSKAAINDKHGFTVQGNFHNFLPRFMELRVESEAMEVNIDALGSQWVLKVTKHFIAMYLLEGPEIKGSRVLLDAGNKACPVKRNLPADHLFKEGGPGYGFRWDNLIQENQFTHVKHVDVKGALPLSFTLLFD